LLIGLAKMTPVKRALMASAETAEKKNDKNQAAILLCLDEIARPCRTVT